MISFITFISVMSQSGERNTVQTRTGEQSTILIKWDNPKVVSETALSAMTQATTSYANNLSAVNTKMTELDLDIKQLLNKEVDSKLTAAAAKFGLTPSKIQTAINKDNTITVISLIVPFLLVAFGWRKIFKYRDKVNTQDFLVLFIIYTALAIASWFIVSKGLTAVFNHDFVQLQNIKNLI